MHIAGGDHQDVVGYLQQLPNIGDIGESHCSTYVRDAVLPTQFEAYIYFGRTDNATTSLWVYWGCPSDVPTAKFYRYHN